ncbi:MAG: DMT family transporter [Planctomycetes bacterium]|nr:DMT family transporter [Planctomycetota bacterium]
MAASPPIAIPPKLALASFIFAIGWASPLFKLAAAPELLASAARVLIAAAILLPFFARDVLDALRSGPRVLARAALAGGLLAAHFAVWVPSLQLTTVAASTLLVATEPLFAAGIESRMLKERLPKQLIFGIIISLGGTAVILSADLDINNPKGMFAGKALLGDALALAGAVFGACYFVVGRAVRKTIPVGAYLVIVNITAGIILLIGSAARGEPWLAGSIEFNNWHGITWKVLGYFFLLAAVPQLLGHGAANVAVRHYPATVVNLAVLSEPLLASGLAFLLFSEVPHNLALFACGGAVLFAGLVVSLRAKRG